MPRYIFETVNRPGAVRRMHAGENKSKLPCPKCAKLFTPAGMGNHIKTCGTANAKPKA